MSNIRDSHQQDDTLVYGGCFVFFLAACGIFTAGLQLNFESRAWWICTGAGIILFFAFLAAITSRERRVAQERIRAQEEYFRALTISNVDQMSGADFERYLQRLLTSQGYGVQITRASGDLGVDLIAVRASERIAVQVKRYGSKISRRAISDAVAGMRHYGCSKAMVITNNYFTPGAVALAASNDCTLVNRDALAAWVTDFQLSSQETKWSESTRSAYSPQAANAVVQPWRIVVCERCAQKLRIPGDRGALRITCPICRQSFFCRS